MVIGILSTIGECFLQLLLVLLLAPLLQGVLEVTKASLNSRQGPPVWQGYFDLMKYLRKEQTFPAGTTWIFHSTPWIALAGVTLALLLIPTIIAGSPLGYAGDAMVLVAILSGIRFFWMLASWDSGSTAAIVGSTRIGLFSVGSDPALLLCIIALCAHVGTLSIGSAVRLLALQGTGLFQPFWFLGFVSMCLLVLIETERLPLGTGDAKEWLQMGETSLLLEYSGPSHAAMLLARWLKQLLFYSLFVNLFFPWGLSDGHSLLGTVAALVIYAAKLLIVAVLVAAADSFYGRARSDQISKLLFLTTFLSMLALLSNFLIKG